MDLGLAGATVLVTGGSKGIGLACARRLAQEGASVAIASRDRAHLDHAVEVLVTEGLSATPLVVDLTDPAAARTLASATEQALGGLDVLVNCAGAARRENPPELTAEMWHHAMDAKFFSCLHAMMACLPGMIERGGGTMVNVIGAGGKAATPTHLTGGAANAALMLSTAGLGNAFAGDGIRVNGVNPGLVATDRIRRAVSTQARLEDITEDEARLRIEQRLPMKRLARPDEIADVVAFLASPRSGYVNGAILTVDGAALPTVL